MNRKRPATRAEQLRRPSEHPSAAPQRARGPAPSSVAGAPATPARAPGGAPGEPLAPAYLDDPTKWDIFGLGVLAWHMWTLRHPFEDGPEEEAPGAVDDAEINLRVARGERPSFRSGAGGSAPWPAALRALVERTWAQDPADRPRAEHVAAALQRPELRAEVDAVARLQRQHGAGRDDDDWEGDEVEHWR